MRTTLSLDDDVAALLERVRRNNKASFKDTVNTALREGLKQMAVRPVRKKRFETASADLGRCLVSNLDDVASVLAEIEGEQFK